MNNNKIVFKTYGMKVKKYSEGKIIFVKAYIKIEEGPSQKFEGNLYLEISWVSAEMEE